MTDYDSSTLDALEADLRATSPSEPLTSGELAARHFPDDSAGNPTTRKAIKHLMRARNLPILGGGNGYYIPQCNADVAEIVQSLESRKQGITERQELIINNWAAHSPGVDPTAEAATDGGHGLSDAEKLAREPDWTPPYDMTDSNTDTDTDTDSTDTAKLTDEERERIENDPVLEVSDFIDTEDA